MVLLDADPLAGVANFSRIVAVVKQGDYLPAESIIGDGQKAKTVRNPDAFRMLGPEDQPEAVVERMLAAFNRHDVDGVLATYSPGIEFFVMGGDRCAPGRGGRRTQHRAVVRSEHGGAQAIGAGTDGSGRVSL